MLANYIYNIQNMFRSSGRHPVSQTRTDKMQSVLQTPCKLSLYPPQTVFVGGYTVFTLSESPSDRPTDRVSETFCFFNNFKNH